VGIFHFGNFAILKLVLIFTLVIFIHVLKGCMFSVYF